MPGHVDLKRFDTPDEVRVLEKGRLAVVRIGGIVLGPAAHVPAVPHSWMVGDRPYESLHHMGADAYARKQP